MIRIGRFRRHAVRRQRSRVDFLELEMRMPDEFSLEPLAAHPLIAKLHTDLVNVPFDMFHSPFAEPNPLPSIFHRSDMLVHGLQYRLVSDRRIALNQSQCFSFS